MDPLILSKNNVSEARGDSTLGLPDIMIVHEANV